MTPSTAFLSFDHLSPATPDTVACEFGSCTDKERVNRAREQAMSAVLACLQALPLPHRWPLIISLYCSQNTFEQAQTWRHPPIPVLSYSGTPHQGTAGFRLAEKTRVHQIITAQCTRTGTYLGRVFFSPVYLMDIPRSPHTD